MLFPNEIPNSTCRSCGARLYARTGRALCAACEKRLVERERKKHEQEREKRRRPRDREHRD